MMPHVEFNAVLTVAYLTGEWATFPRRWRIFTARC